MTSAIPKLVAVVAGAALLLGAAPAQSPAKSPAGEPPADLILHDATVWTVDAARPEAEAVAVRGNRIVRVGSDREVLALRGPKTRVIDLDRRMVLPGFIDAHTHFEGAVRDFFHLRLNDVADEKALLREISERAAQVPAGFWITGGQWSAAGGWPAEKRKDATFRSFEPDLAAVDRLTPDHPVLLQRYDGAWFVNSYGARLHHIGPNTPDPSGGRYGRDPRTGALTGMLYGTAGPRLMVALPPESRAKMLVGGRAMLAKLAANGITSIHDIARVPSISDQQVFQTAVERFATDLSLFTDLRKAGQLTARVYPILSIRTWGDLAGAGIRPQSGDEMIRYGALKTFVDGFLMFRPYPNNPKFAGALSFRNKDERQLEREIVAASKAGWDVGAHVTGDKAHAMAIDWYAAARKGSPRERRDRLIHAWYPRAQDITRGGRMRLIADITPYHLVREIDGMANRLHPDQLPSAFAWATMIDRGWRINIGSDWPGSFDGSHAAPLNPLENIYYATTRSGLDGMPAGGFAPGQALTIEQAIQAYTINPAFSSYEEKVKGSITPGKLADLVVLSRDIRRVPRRQLLDTAVVYTVFDGKLLYQAKR